MEEKVLYSMESPFQQEINVKGYYFGKNEGKEHSACIVGALRGNEYQQLYICSKLIDVLKKIAIRDAYQKLKIAEELKKYNAGETHSKKDLEKIAVAIFNF